MEPFEVKSLRIRLLLPYAIVVVGLQLHYSTASPLGLTNAASELHPKEELPSPSSYWIGSHNLNFTPNPFLQRKLELPGSQDQVESDSHSSSTSLSSQIETTTSVAAPTNAPEIKSKTNSTSVRPRRKGRKVKGRRKNRNRNSSKSQATNATTTAAAENNLDKSRRAGISEQLLFPDDSKSSPHPETVRFTAEEAKSGISLDKSVGRIPRMEGATTNDAMSTSIVGTASNVFEQLSPSSLPIIQPIANKLPIEEYIHITTPEPIMAEYIDPRSNQIPVDFAGVDPNKLNPSYFRNIIIKSMMDRLAKVGLVTRLPGKR